MTADCLPVVLADRAGSRVAVAHAGWRGLAHGVVEATVRALHCPPAELLAWLGPAIGQQAFEVGIEVRDAFVARSAQLAGCFAENERGRFQADLYGLATAALADAGVTRRAWRRLVHGKRPAAVLFIPARRNDRPHGDPGVARVRRVLRSWALQRR